MSRYGFYTEQYKDTGGLVRTLGTGDGKARFSDTFFEDGRVGIAMSYGHSGGIGDEVDHPEGTTVEDIGAQFQVTFTNQESIDALIKAALAAKNKLSLNSNRIGGSKTP